MSDDTIESQYPKLEKPIFISSIPPHLVSSLTESERFLVSSLSKIEQQCNWLVDTQILHNKSIIDLDIRIKKIEQWKDAITSKWSIIYGVIIILGTAAATTFVQKLIET